MGAQMKPPSWSPGLEMPGFKAPDEDAAPDATPQPLMMPMPPQPPPEQMAMAGLEGAISAPPGAGWADDPAMMQTVQGLGERSQGMPMDTLRRVFQKQGRVY
jgi:hypothetical protein